MYKLIDYKTIKSGIAVLCILIHMQAFAQAPVITVRDQPIVLKLDAAGQYNFTASGDHPVIIKDLATVANSTDSATKLKFKPQLFDCSTSGNQVVNLTALTNGSRVTTTNPAAVRITDLYSSCVDPLGNIYFAGNNSFIIRKITPAGDVSIFAGSGVSGDADGKGTKASFSFINENGMISDKNGNIYFADVNNKKVRKITPDGVVSTYVTMANQINAIALDSHNNLYVSSLEVFDIFKITPDKKFSVFAGSEVPGDSDGTGKQVRFYWPISLAVDKLDNVYVGIMETKAGDRVKIKKITPDGTVTTFYDPGKLGMPAINDPVRAFYSGPMSLKFDSAGNLYIGDAGMLKMMSPDGTVKIVAGDNSLGNVDGTGPNAHFWAITSVDFDPCGNIIVADYNNNRVKRITLGGVVTTIAGGGSNDLEGNVGPSTCQGSIINIPVNVQSTPAFTSVYHDLTLQDCANLADYTLKATAIDNCPDSQIKFTQSPAPNSAIFNNVPVPVTLTATDKTGGTASVLFTVTAKYTGAPPGRSVSVAASTDKICVGKPVTFKATVINGDPATSFQWLLNGSNVGPDAPTFTTTDLKDGDLINVAATTGNGCGIPNLGLDVKVNVNPIPTVSLNPVEEILSGQHVSLIPAVSGDIASYTWTPATGLSDAGSKYPVASPDVTTTYKLKVASTAGCEAEAGVTVKVTPVINIPNTFTPNGDGINDLWAIKYLDGYTTGTVTVFNRNGSIVFRSRGYPKPWDGSYNGSVLPTGVYYYVIDLKDGSPLRSGNVCILR